MKLPDVDPSACSSPHPSCIEISLPVNPEGVFTNFANFKYLPRDPTLLFQQKSCATGTSVSLPVVISRPNGTAIVPPQFDLAHVNPGIFGEKFGIESCFSRPVTPTSIFTTANDRNRCNAITNYCNGYHIQLPCIADLSKIVLLHKSVATNHVTANSNFSRIYNSSCD